MSQQHPKQDTIDEAVAILKSLAKDIATLQDRWHRRDLGIDTYLKLNTQYREKQVEVLKILTELTKDPIGRWDKMIAD